MTPPSRRSLWLGLAPTVALLASVVPEVSAQWMDAIKADMQLNEAPLRSGAPTGPRWTRGAGIGMGGAARGDATPSWWTPANTAFKSSTPWNSITPWFVIYPGAGNGATNVRVKISGIALYVLKKSANTWEKIDTGTGNPTWASNYDFELNADARLGLAVPRAESGGKRSYKLTAVSNPIHGGENNRAIDGADVAAVYAQLTTELVLDDPAGIDDRASAQILTQIGIDYRPTTTTAVGHFAPMKYVPDSAFSRFGLVSAAPRTHHVASIDPPGGSNNGSVYVKNGGVVTIPVAQFMANPPPNLPSAPRITRQPGDIQTNGGRDVDLTVESMGSDPRTFQWFKNGTPIAGATTATYSLRSASTADRGEYTVVIRNSLGVVASETAQLGVDETSRLANLATRGSVNPGDGVIIAGFAVSGPGAKTVLVRGIGPGLASFGVAGFLANPKLVLFDANGTKVAENDDWGSGNSGATASAFAEAGAFSLGSGSLDAALVTTVIPGLYTAQLSGERETSGAGLVEIYEFDRRSSRLVNLSTRLTVGAEAAVGIAGIVVSGPVPKKLLIRGIGPTLSRFGVQDPLADPVLSIIGPANAIIAVNDNWGAASNATDIAAASATVGAFAFPASSNDAAVLVTLPPGIYTGVVSSSNGTRGVALVEVYEVP